MINRWTPWSALLAAALLSGCAALNTLHGEISTFGEWPTGRAPGSYAFDRLPSQQARPEQAAALEASARPALEGAGFREAAPGQQAELLVQLAARSSRTELEVWGDPLWWRGGWGLHRRGWSGSFWVHTSPFNERYEREVALLLRDAASGKPLYEARASNEGSNSAGDALNTALFRAALTDFPRSGPNPRQVTVQLP